TLLSDVAPDNIVLFGDSAGGNLAAVVSLMAHDRGEFMPQKQMLLYPSTYNDHSPSSRFDSIRENGSDYLLTSRDIEGYMELYLSA
ncbi:MAG: alpha/beta hydrolase fold domain-containing protein, partial [Raoultibacter sp.]